MRLAACGPSRRAGLGQAGAVVGGTGRALRRASAAIAARGGRRPIAYVRSAAPASATVATRASSGI